MRKFWSVLCVCARLREKVCVCLCIGMWWPIKIYDHVTLRMPVNELWRKRVRVKPKTVKSKGKERERKGG